MEAEYFYWSSLLDGAELGVDVHNDGETPQPGFYRTKEGEPVAVWQEDDGSVVMTVKGVEVPADKLVWYWQRSMTRPVEEEVFRDVEAGQPWPDMDEAVADSIGDNIKDATDLPTIEALIAGLEAGVEKYAEVRSDDEAARAQSLRSRILELGKRADAVRTEIKAPHLKECKAIDAAWQPVVKRAEAAGLKVRSAIGRWGDVKRAAAVEAARRAAEQNVSRETPVEVEAAPKAQVKGGYGRAASVRVKPTVISIDPDVVFKSYNRNSEVIALLTKLCQRDLDAGITTPGATVEDRSVVS